MTAITYLQTVPWRVLGWRWRRKATNHQGATMESPLYSEILPAEGVLRDAHEDIADLEMAADKARAEIAERGNDTRDDVLGGIDPEIHAANEPIFAQLLASFDQAYNTLIDKFTNEPQAPRRVLAAAQPTQEINLAELEALLADDALPAGAGA